MAQRSGNAGHARPTPGPRAPGVRFSPPAVAAATTVTVLALSLAGARVVRAADDAESPRVVAVEPVEPVALGRPIVFEALAGTNLPIGTFGLGVDGQVTRWLSIGGGVGSGEVTS